MVAERLLSSHEDADKTLRGRYGRRPPYVALDTLQSARQGFIKALPIDRKGTRWSNDKALPAFVSRFETWQFGVLNPDTLGIRLIDTLTAQLQAEVEEAWHATRRSAKASALDMVHSRALQAGKLLKNSLEAVAAPVTATAMSVTTGGLVDSSAILDSMGSDDHKSAELLLSEYKYRFAQFVERVLVETSFSRVVVFIDDLDRVPPACAITMLEMLKNFVDVPGCVFVLAVDYEVIRTGVRQKLNIEDPKKAQAFFDKIIQVPFDVPINQYNLRGLLGAYLEGRGAVRPGRTARMKISKDRMFTQHIATMVQRAIGKNPRAFKRFANTVDLLHEVVLAASVSREQQPPNLWSSFGEWFGLVALVAMQVRWTQTSRWLTELGTEEDRAPTLAARLNELQQLLLGEEAVDADSSEVFRRVREDVVIEEGTEMNEELVQASDAWDDLASFMEHLLAVLDRPHGNQRFDAAEVEEMAKVSEFLSVTARGRALKLTGRDKFDRAIDRLGRLAGLLRELVAFGYASRQPYTSATQASAVETGIYFQVRYKDGDKPRTYSVFQVHKDGHLLLRHRHGPPLDAVLPSMVPLAEPYEEEPLGRAMYIPPKAMRSLVGSREAEMVLTELKAWLPTQWRGAKEALIEATRVDEELAESDED